MKTPPAILRPLCYLLLSASLAGCGGRTSEPEETASGVSPGEPEKKITLLFAGDLMQHMPQVTAARQDSTFDYTDCFRHIAPFFRQADLVVLNLETTLTPHSDYSGYPRFASPPSLAHAVRRAGADIVTTANNHICDRGGKGIRSTLETLDKAGLLYTGVFTDSTDFRRRHPLYVSANGIGIALLNYTYGTNGLPVPHGIILNGIDTTRIAEDLRRIDRTKADHVVAFFHWGEEYSRRPNRQQRELAAWCHARGADLVIGSHPHVLQPIETLLRADSTPGGVTAYSLGNFVSNQRKRYTDGGIVLRIEITHRDSLPPAYRTDYLLTWVHTPWEAGRRRYRILPSYVADTLLRHDPAAETAYRKFASDSRTLLDGRPFVGEIASP